MSKIKQILRLVHQGESIKSIARTQEVSRNTVRRYIGLLGFSGRSIPELLAMEDHDLHLVFYPQHGELGQDPRRYRDLFEHFEQFKAELTGPRPRPTFLHLWLDYTQSTPNAYGYTQFCHYLNRYMKAEKATLIGIPHPPGEQLYVDFAGIKMTWYEPDTGKAVQVPVFVGTLGMSQYTWVQAVPSQRAVDFLGALSGCLRHIGGVPSAIIPDNLKAAVIKSDRYEPQLNTLLDDFANHHDTCILPTRPTTPQDKSLVETAVREAYRNVYIPLRKRRFYSLGELNEAIAEQLQVWYDKPFQGRTDTRRSRFEQVEKAALRPLPLEPFRIKSYATLKVRRNSHITFSREHTWYSVPHALIGQHVEVISTDSCVQIFHRHRLVARHMRLHKEHAHSTQAEHLPANHQFWLKRSKGWYLNRIEGIGPQTLALVEHLMEHQKHPERTFRTCDGILSLSRRYGSEQIEAASAIALKLQNPCYTFIKRLLDRGLDRIHMPQEDPGTPTLPDHGNIRGKAHFQSTASHHAKPQLP